MTNFLLLWKADMSRASVIPEERLARWTILLNMVKDDLENGRLKDWGAFPGEHAGYAIMEGIDQDVIIATERYAPYIRFKTQSVVSVSQALEGLKILELNLQEQKNKEK